MCSVSFVPHARGFYLGMNRDESRERIVAMPPALTVHGGRLSVYPREPNGGTWVGVNDAGLTFALINWYELTRGPGSGQVSRGTMIPALLASNNLNEVRNTMAALSSPELAPFRLLAFCPHQHGVCEFRWDQRSLGERLHPWQPQHWFSSGFDEPRARHERARVARLAWREPDAGRLPWLRRLHASHAPARGPFCLCMHRNEAATVSYSEIAVTSLTATMRYFPGPLCEIPRALTTHRITLREFSESVRRPRNGKMSRLLTHPVS